MGDYPTRPKSQVAWLGVITALSRVVGPAVVYVVTYIAIVESSTAQNE